MKSMHCNVAFLHLPLVCIRRHRRCPVLVLLMAKYKEGKADIRCRENRTIRSTKPDSPVSLSQVSTSTSGSSFGKRSRTSPRQNLEGQDHCQQDYHPAAYFPVGPPMPEPWGPLPMMYLLSYLGIVVRTMGTTADALPPGMVRTC
jgi:hypothetical protein